MMRGVRTSDSEYVSLYIVRENVGVCKRQGHFNQLGNNRVLNNVVDFTNSNS